MKKKMVKDYKFLVGGDWKESKNKVKIANPFNGEVVGSVSLASPEDADGAVRAAERAFSETREMPSYRRAEILARIAQGIEARKEEITKTIVQEAGKPWQYSRAEVERAISTFTIAQEETKRIYGESIPMDLTKAGTGYFCLTKRFPLGPILAITPFNFPLNLVAHKLAPGIASGNTMVLKPPPQAPITSLILGEIVGEAGAVPGTLNVIPCPLEVAENLVGDDRLKMLSFTGSAKVGWHLKSKAGKKRVALELGGNAGAVVHSDADLNWASHRLALGAFAYAGQICISVQRIYVEEKIYREFLELFTEDVKNLKRGDPGESDTAVGPLIDQAAAERVEKWIEEAKAQGAKVLLGGRRTGSMLEPTIIAEASSRMKVSCEEVFGPVVTLTPYQEFKDAIREVNNSFYGLQAGVFTKDIYRILYSFNNLAVGGVIINDYPTFRLDHTPYGGVKDSGLGREGVRSAMEEMSEVKVLVLNLR